MGTAGKNEAGQNSTAEYFVLEAARQVNSIALINQQCDDPCAIHCVHSISTRVPGQLSLRGYNGGHRRQAHVPTAWHLGRQTTHGTPSTQSLISMHG
jgi:hypothetical protein